MFKIGPKIYNNHCCEEGCSCHKAQHQIHQNCSCCCNEEPKADKFEKVYVDKPSLKKVLPLGAVAGLASAGLVVAASNILAKVTKKSPLTTVIATGVGLGVATGVINGTLANTASKQLHEQEKKSLIG